MAGTIQAKVLVPFVDTDCGSLRELGELIEVSEERFAEINAVGEGEFKTPFVEAVQKPGKPERAGKAE